MQEKLCLQKLQCDGATGCKQNTSLHNSSCCISGMNSGKLVLVSSYTLLCPKQKGCGWIAQVQPLPLTLTLGNYAKPLQHAQLQPNRQHKCAEPTINLHACMPQSSTQAPSAALQQTDKRLHLILSCELHNLMLQLSDLIMLRKVGGPQPAALLLQLIQLVLHVIPLLLCHTKYICLMHLADNHSLLCNMPCLHMYLAHGTQLACACTLRVHAPGPYMHLVTSCYAAVHNVVAETACCQTQVECTFETPTDTPISHEKSCITYGQDICLAETGPGGGGVGGGGIGEQGDQQC